MNKLTGEDGFMVSAVPAEEREKKLDGVRIDYGENLGFAEYSKGMELETVAGDVIETETAEVVMIYAQEHERGIGTKLLAKLIEQTREDGFTYIRTSPILNPAIIKMVEKAFQDGKIENRAYRAHRPGDMFDMPSSGLLQARSAVTAEEAMDQVGHSPRVECVIEL